MNKTLHASFAVLFAAASLSAAQLDHWEYDAGTGVIDDGVFAFTVGNVNASAKTLRVYALDTAWMAAHCDATAPQPLDFSKPVVIDGADYDITVVCPQTESATADNCIPQAWRWLPGSLVLNPKTKQLGKCFCYGATNLTGRLVIPATLTGLPQSFCRGIANNAAGRVKLSEVEFQGPCKLNGVRIFQWCALTGIIGSQYITGLQTQSFLQAGSSTTPVDLRGLDSTTIPTEAFSGFSAPYYILPDTITKIAGLHGCTITNFPPASLEEIATSGTIGGLSVANEGGVVVFPEGFATTPASPSNGAHYGPFNKATGIVEADFPKTYTAVTPGLFANCASIEAILFRATALTQLGSGAFNAKNLREIRFCGAPPPAASVADDFLGATETTGHVKIRNLSANQVTLFVPRGMGWESLADGGTIPGTVTKGTTQNIRYWTPDTKPTILCIR